MFHVKLVKAAISVPRETERKNEKMFHVKQKVKFMNGC